MLFLNLYCVSKSRTGYSHKMQRTVSHSTKEKTLQRKEPHETFEADQRSAGRQLRTLFFWLSESALSGDMPGIFHRRFSWLKMVPLEWCYLLPLTTVSQKEIHRRCEEEVVSAEMAVRRKKNKALPSSAAAVQEEKKTGPEDLLSESDDEEHKDVEETQKQRRQCGDAFDLALWYQQRGRREDQGSQSPEGFHPGKETQSWEEVRDQLQWMQWLVFPCNFQLPQISHSTRKV